MKDPPSYDELLPSYSCTVYKQGYVRLKQELSIGGMNASKNRSWNTVYFKLWGTLLQIYKNEKSHYPIHHISMLKAHCGIAKDYKRHANVLRLQLGTTKEQYLLRPTSITETISWFEHLQSSINICTDIDRRRMPHVFTMARESENHTRTVTLKIGKTQAIVPIFKI